MANQLVLMEIFVDTQRQVKENQELAARTKCMQASSRLYLDDFDAIVSNVKCEHPEVEVVEDTTFHAAQAYVTESNKIAVLNFANSIHPGGGVKYGAMAQEECLCRSSNLYEGLTLPYFLKHYYKWNSKNTGDMGSDRIIYTPDVTVFKDDEVYPQNIDDWFQVDVITCAAPYYDTQKKRKVSMEQLHQVWVNRIQNILEVAVSNDVDVLVLGAFGCGIFNNPPDLVAAVMKYWLIEQEYAKYFQKVVFAIKKNNRENTNLKAFQNAFSTR